MQMQNNSEKKFDQYLDHLEFLSSKIADNISMGLFEDINKMDYERKAIISKIYLLEYIKLPLKLGKA